MNETKVDFALDYVESGYSVIPLRSTGDTKKPSMPWKKYQDEKADAETVRSWFAFDPDQNIGIVTGKISDLVVLDIDVDNGATPPTYADMIEAGILIDQDNAKDITLIQTGGGGYHMYFKYSGGYTNAIGIVKGKGWKLDIRTDGGYVVAPGSIHPRTGKVYKFINRPTESAECPIISSSTTETVATEERFTVDEKIEPGKRHDTMVKLACSLRASGLEEQEIASALISTYGSRGDNDEEFSPDKLTWIARDICARYQPGKSIDVEKNKLETTKSMFAWGQDAFDIMTAPVQEGEMTGCPGIDEIGGIKPGLYTIAARPGEGKSTYLASICEHLLLADMKVAILTGEMNPNEFGAWIKKAVSNDKTFKHLFSSPLCGINELPSTIDANHLVNSMLIDRPRILLLDHIGKLTYQGYQTQRVLELQMSLNLIHSTAMKIGCTVIAAAHLSRESEKREGGRPRFSDLRESGAIENNSDIVIYLYRGRDQDMGDDKVKMVFDCGKNRSFGILCTVGMILDRPGRRFYVATM